MKSMKTKKSKAGGRRSFTQEEIVSEAQRWIKTHYGDSDYETRMTRLGLLYDFVTDIVPNTKL